MSKTYEVLDNSFAFRRTDAHKGSGSDRNTYVPEDNSFAFSRRTAKAAGGLVTQPATPNAPTSGRANSLSSRNSSNMPY